MKVMKDESLDVGKLKVSVEKPSRPFIPNKTIIELWCKSGGHCQLCNEKLWQDGLTYHKINQSNIAHIVAWTPNGPRGNVDDSERLATDISNLMLVCAKHNKLFDSNEIIKEHSVERLMQLKKEHEDRIDVATSIKPENQTTPLVYMSKIGENSMNISEKEIRNALFPNFYPKTEEVINLNFEVDDTDSDFWKTEKKQLDKYFNRNIYRKLGDGTISHLSVFAFAPQPLLIYLGYLLGDKYNTEIYPLQRNPKEWKWRENSLTTQQYNVTKPTNTDKPPVLTISLSDTITEERVSECIGCEYSRWDISISKAEREFLTNKKSLYEFSRIISEVLDQIKMCME